MTEEKVRSETRIQVMDRKKVLRSHKRYWFFRRGQDILFSGMALIVLSPILLITALAVWLDDPHGSPIFKQLRCGRDDKLLPVYGEGLNVRDWLYVKDHCYGILE